MDGQGISIDDQIAWLAEQVAICNAEATVWGQFLRDAPAHRPYQREHEGAREYAAMLLTIENTLRALRPPLRFPHDDMGTPT